jgi:hypothetical protein
LNARLTLTRLKDTAAMPDDRTAELAHTPVLSCVPAAETVAAEAEALKGTVSMVLQEWWLMCFWDSTAKAAQLEMRQLCWL